MHEKELEHQDRQSAGRLSARFLVSGVSPRLSFRKCPPLPYRLPENDTPVSAVLPSVWTCPRHSLQRSGSHRSCTAMYGKFSLLKAEHCYSKAQRDRFVPLRDLLPSGCDTGSPVPRSTLMASVRLHNQPFSVPKKLPQTQSPCSFRNCASSSSSIARIRTFFPSEVPVILR